MKLFSPSIKALVTFSCSVNDIESRIQEIVNDNPMFCVKGCAGDEEVTIVDTLAVGGGLANSFYPIIYIPKSHFSADSFISIEFEFRSSSLFFLYAIALVSAFFEIAFAVFFLHGNLSSQLLLLMPVGSWISMVSLALTKHKHESIKFLKALSQKLEGQYIVQHNYFSR